MNIASQPEPEPRESAARSRRRRRCNYAWLLLCLAAVVVVAGWLLIRDRRDAHIDNVEQHRTYVEALAATEEGDSRRALELWQRLVDEQSPVENDLKVNQAITLIRWIEQIQGALNSGIAEPSKRASLEVDLTEAYGRAKTLVDELAELKQLDSIVFLRTELLLKQPPEISADSEVTRKTRALEVLSSGLRHQAGSALLACKFDEVWRDLPSEFSALLQRDNAQYLWDAYQLNPRNLYLLKRTAEVLLANQDPRLGELLAPSIGLTASMVESPEIARTVAQLNPSKLVEQVAAAIKAGDWGAARVLQRWLNTMVGMSAFEADSRIAKPDVLALLDTSNLEGIAATHLAEQSARVESIPQYETFNFGVPAIAIGWYDFDFDLDFDVVLASGTKLRVFTLDDSRFSTEPFSSVDVGIEVSGFQAVDLYEVDRPSRPQWPARVPDLMQAAPDQNNSQELPQDDSANRHDTLQEIVVWGPAGVRIVTLDTPSAQMRVVTEITGLEFLRNITQIAPIDFESDGDLDLAIAIDGQFYLMQNNGDRTFTDISRFSELPTNCQYMLTGDFNFDTDQDLWLIDSARQQPQLLENLRHSEFRIRELTGEAWMVGTLAACTAVGETDGNGSWDFITVSPTQARLTRTRLLEGGQIAPLSFEDLPLGGQAMALEDLNNDGYLDLIVGGPTGLRGRFGAPAGKFGEQSMKLSLNGQSVSKLSVIDCNGNGQLDILAIADGLACVCLASSKSADKFLEARIRGINDVNGGGRVNHYCIGSTLQVATGGRLLSRIVTQPVTHFGLGNEPADNLRIIFNNGLTQNVQRPLSNTMVEEKQTLRGSCPFVYGWNGRNFELITDLLWNAPLGLQIARGSVLPDRRWENLVLPGEKMQPKDGKIELRVTEELWEIAYFDKIQLTAIDHPADVRLFSNEKVGPAEIAEHHLFYVRNSVLPKSATDSHGRDVLDRIIALDQNYVQAFERQICQGLTEPHFVELDFGSLPLEQHCRLFLTGWMFPTDTSLNIGIDQNSNRELPQPPSLWVVGPNGNWECSQPFMGFPGGKPKSIVIDLENVFRGDDHRLRIAGSQQIYWDEAFISWDSDDAETVEQRLSLATAELRFRGVGRQLPRGADQPHWYQYESPVALPVWPPLDGPFTRYGEVKGQLFNADDRMVVMTVGDEIHVGFTLPPQPLPAGWKRDYVMHNEGWDKDADLNTLKGTSSLPLPFEAQLAYPPPPEQAREATEVWNKNASSLTRPPRVSPAQWARAFRAEQTW